MAILIAYLYSLFRETCWTICFTFKSFLIKYAFITTWSTNGIATRVKLPTKSLSAPTMIGAVHTVLKIVVLVTELNDCWFCKLKNKPGELITHIIKKRPADISVSFFLLFIWGERLGYSRYRIYAYLELDLFNYLSKYLAIKLSSPEKF